MELKPYNITVSVCYPPDTDTPGYEEEMKTKPALTKKLSESGNLFKPADVAKDIVKYSNRGYFGISTGLDGWLLKQLHPGMSPVNCLWETVQPIFFSSVARIISIFYVKMWDSECFADAKMSKKKPSRINAISTKQRPSDHVQNVEATEQVISESCSACNLLGGFEKKADGVKLKDI